jgi:hypothetical protein
MKARTLLASLAILIFSTSVAFADTKFQVKADEYDPAKTFLVQAQWLDGIGCPTGAKVATYPSTSPTGTYTDPACPTGDSSDKKNEGLLLAKTGPTTNNASAFAEIKGVKGITLTELGYDLRKPTNTSDPRGSHCGAGSPRFNITTTTGFFFLGCNSPAPTTQTAGNGWLRLRWGGSGGPLQAYLDGTLTTVTGEVTRLSIVFDEGQDTGPDNFGLAVLDNIDVNGTLVGSHEAQKDNRDGEKENGNNENGNDDGKDNEKAAKHKGHVAVKEDNDDHR